MESDILTIEEVAKYLRVSERTVYDWAQKKEIPAGKIGNVWRFKKAEIEKWVDERLSPAENLKKEKMKPICIKEILSPERVVFIKESSKYNALIELTEILAKSPQVKLKEELLAEIIRREELMSTAVGRGIAIPHVRLTSITDITAAAGICKNPIQDFQTLDDIPVNIIIMIAAAYDQHVYYLKTLSHFSSKLKNPDLRNSIASASQTSQIYELLVQ